MKIKIFFILICFAFFIVSAQEPEKTVPTETVEEIKKEQKPIKKPVSPKKDAIQEEKKKLEKKIKDNEERIDELEERLDTVERATLVDRVSLSMDAKIAVHNFIYREKSPEATKELGLLKKDGDTYGLFSIMGRLKMVANLGDTFQFTGWLSMYKQFNESSPYRYQNENIVPIYDMGRAKYPGDSRAYFERLFIDWYITKWLAFSGGRGPATEGSPADLRYDNVELSSFQESMINSPVDGMYLTLNIGAITSLKNTYLRFWYVNRVFITDNIPNTFFATKDNPYLHFFGINYTMDIPKTTGGRFFLSAGYTPNISSVEQYADMDGDGKDEKLHTSGTMGSLLAWNVHFKFKEVFRSPVDIFFGTGGSTVFPATRTKDHLNRGFVGTPVDKDSGLSTPLYTILGSKLDGKSLPAFTFFGGLRINFPWEIAGEKFKIGADYNYGSKNFFMYYAPDFTGTNRFAIRGHHAEGYFILPLHRKANIKVCYIFEKHEHAFSLFEPVGGSVPEIDERIHSFYLMLNTYF